MSVIICFIVDVRLQSLSKMVELAGVEVGGSFVLLVVVLAEITVFQFFEHFPRLIGFGAFWYVYCATFCPEDKGAAFLPTNPICFWVCS